MSSVGSIEILLILLIAAVVIGPKHLQSVVRVIGKTIRVLKRAITEIKEEVLPTSEIKSVIEGIPTKKDLDEITDTVSDLKNVVTKNIPRISDVKKKLL